MSLENLKSKVIELGVALGREVEPESTKAKLEEQIATLESELAGANPEKDQDEQGGQSEPEAMVKVMSTSPGKVITEFDGKPVEIMPGKNTIPAPLAEELKAFVQVVSDDD